MRRAPWMALIAALLAGCAAMTFAEPPLERTVVVAVADEDGSRILVRWRTLEGERRYQNFDVLRRLAGEADFVQLNGDPITALTEVAEIEEVFTAPGREDALAWIQESLGPDYANELLALQAPDAPESARMQLAFLPDHNYGAALALGLGWLDEDVIDGETYVYEVWGLDDLGFPVERLGRASATAGSPQGLTPPEQVACADLGDQKAHLAAFLRWSETPPENRKYTFGQEVLRAPRNGDGTCPPVGPGQPGTVKANRFPVVAGSTGHLKEGRQLFETHCASCHSAPDPRDVSPPDGVKGGTLARFRRRQYSKVGGISSFPHDTPGLNALSTETLQSIFDWIQEFEYRDDGSGNPDHPVEEGQTYCYSVVQRDLLGQLGTPSVIEQCTIQDRIAPAVPALIASERIVEGDHEICRISWQRNDDPDDDTVSYEVLRKATDVPRNQVLDDIPVHASVAHPSSGDRVVFDDTDLGLPDAAHRYFYAARSVDEAGNRSPISGWVPCVPRDILAPPPPALSIECCAGAEGCRDWTHDEEWMAAGGDPMISTDPGRCPPRIGFDFPEDTFRVRLYRSFDGVDYEPADDAAVSPYSPEFSPSLDQKIWYKARGFDKSGNLGGWSSPLHFVAIGQNGPPPPKIVGIVLAPEGSDMGWIKIKFRALDPAALLGFSLYKKYVEPTESPVIDLGANLEFVTRYHDNNLSTDPLPSDPQQWAVLPGARTLDQLLESTPPASGSYLIYRPSDGTYEMKVDVVETANIILELHAIGWSGREGKSLAYGWDGWSNDDKQLDWPGFMGDNLAVFGSSDSELTVVSGPGYNELSWSTAPKGCIANGGANPFVVFRRRAEAPNWKQISPLFTCGAGSPDTLRYLDTDVEDGFEYTYIVVQLNRMGEFTFRYGPTTHCYPDASACE